LFDWIDTPARAGQRPRPIPAHAGCHLRLERGRVAPGCDAGIGQNVSGFRDQSSGSWRAFVAVAGLILSFR
jgi:hypothetical protein